MGTILKAIGIVFLVLIAIGMVFALVRALFWHALFAALVIGGLLWLFRVLAAPMAHKAAQTTAARSTRKQERVATKELAKLETQVNPPAEKPNILRIGRNK